MSTKIKDAILISNVTDSIKIPVGNTGDDTQPLAISVEQLKYHINSGLSTVATSGSYNDLTDKPTIPTNTKSLLVTYEDGTQETIKVYTA